MTPGQLKAMIDARRDDVFARLMGRLQRPRSVVVVKAPPGSGKTHLLVDSVAAALGQDMRVAVATQTSAQADAVCLRLARRVPAVASTRFLGSGGAMEERHSLVAEVRHGAQLPSGNAIVVATTAKWEYAPPSPAFDVVVVDEAWQMPWFRFMGLGNVAPRFVLIGDPGQIPPIVTVDASRWEVAPRPPHRAAPELILADQSLDFLDLELPASRRLPYDTVQLIQPFYDFPFASYSAPGERRIETSGRSRDDVDKALDLLGDGSVSGITLPCPDGGPPLDVDDAIAATAVDVGRRALRRQATFVAEDASPAERRIVLEPRHIGIVATHRVMNARIAELLPREMRDVRVETPERWQGLERELMVMVHPLSGVVDPSSFDLDTGRLCVMSSRHRGGLVVLSRDHVRESLEEHVPVADQPVGQPDSNGRGHTRHLGFWTDSRGTGEVGRVIHEFRETVLTYRAAQRMAWCAGDKSLVPAFHPVDGIVRNQNDKHFGEFFTLRHFHEAEGWLGFRFYALNCTPDLGHPRFGAGGRKLITLLPTERLLAYRRARAEFLQGRNPEKGEPDLFLYRDSTKEVVFLEVKLGSDWPDVEGMQLACLVQIRDILGCRAEIVHLREEGERYVPRVHAVELARRPVEVARGPVVRKRGQGR